MNLHIMKASGRLAQIEPELIAAFDEVTQKIKDKLSLPDIDVMMADNPDNVIPETGVGGFAINANLLYVNIDPESLHFKSHMREEIVSTLAHELHHCARIHAIGYGKTLLEAMVSEGLADHFDIELNDRKPNPWSVAVNEEQTAALLEKATLEFENESYDHSAWFFGSEDKGIPRWAGYSLGFTLVGNYMKKSGKSAGELVETPARFFSE